jgi:SAM-dependent methyltransferase
MRDQGIELTGERLLTTVSGESVTEHLHRYALAQRYCVGKEVLDIACGEGYGSNLLQQVAARVTGVDIDPTAVGHAAAKYGRPNLTFLQGSCDAIPLADKAFDVVVSFETLEHHAKHTEMLSEIRRVLKPGGLLLISTPDRVNYSEQPGYTNPFHVKELTRAEFRSLLEDSFRNVSILLQRITHGSIVVPEEKGAAELDLLAGSFDSVGPWGVAPVYLIALASDGPLAPIAASFFVGEDILGRQFDAVLTSASYRLGHRLLQPGRWLSRFLKARP